MQTLITNKTLEKLKYDLVRENLISYDDLSKAEAFARENSTHIGYVLVNNNFIKEKTLLEFIEQKLHIPYVNLDDYSLDSRCLTYVSEENARKYKLIAIFKIEDILTIAMADPMDLFVINSIVDELEIKVEPVICSERSIINAINTYYIPVKSESTNPFDWKAGLLNENSDEEQLKKVINNILFASIEEKTHTITFQRDCKGLVIDFNKEEKGVVPELLIPKFVVSLKSLSNLDESIVDLPQLGKYCFELNNKIFTAIISTFPTIKGERISIKLFEPPLPLEEFIKTPSEFDKIIKIASSPGFIAICGVESKDTNPFVYSFLSKLSSLNKNIITLESKVKYELNGVNQTEVNEDTVFSVKDALKHIKFQDPEVIYIENLLYGKNIEFLQNSGKTIITEIQAANKEEALEKAKLLNPLCLTIFVNDKREAVL
ncbi:MAG: ATPase, T2SS/T4P/T4SS family [Candidatus Gastranaerophilaceae bacterium]